jgi:hypothetical protein
MIEANRSGPAALERVTARELESLVTGPPHVGAGATHLVDK